VFAAELLFSNDSPNDWAMLEYRAEYALILSRPGIFL